MRIFISGDGHRLTTARCLCCADDRVMTQHDNRTTSTSEELVIERPQLADGKAVYELIQRSPPLDLNSSYCYFLLCDHHAATCVVARYGKGLVGFLSAYRLPHHPETLFVWQVAVDDALRGHGIASRMLQQLLMRPACASVRYLETTISPTNHTSRRLFQRFAERRHAPWHEETYLGREHFGNAAHEEEMLIRIGPFTVLPQIATA